MDVTIQNKANEALFRQWVEAHADPLYHYSLKHVFDDDLAKDLVQETFLAAWRNMSGYKGEASVKNWLFLILKSKITDHFRKSSTKHEVALAHKEGENSHFFDEEDHWRKGYYPQPWQVDFSNATEAKEFYQVFQSCGKKLKQLQNSAFVMKYVDGLKSEEICKVLGITASNYWVLLHRAKVQLRACLEKNWMSK